MQPHRSSALGYASAASAAHSRVYGACAAEAAASETSGLSVGGCIRARGYFGPHPVYLRYARTYCDRDLPATWLFRGDVIVCVRQRHRGPPVVRVP